MMRKVLKILHTVAACGLIGGLCAYMLLLIHAPQGAPADYADLRQTIKAISDYLLLPSLALALVTGLLAMVVHYPFQEKGWVWVKAATGILMFKGILTIVSAKAGHAADMSRRIADETAPPDALASLINLEWGTLWTVMVLCVANVVLGVWRPKRIFPETKAERAAAAARLTNPATTEGEAASSLPLILAQAGTQSLHELSAEILDSGSRGKERQPG